MTRESAASKGRPAGNEPSVSVAQTSPILLARREAAAYLGFSVSTLERLVARGKAPKPRQVSEKRVAWHIDDLRAWADALPVSEMLPPENGGYGRRGKPRSIKLKRQCKVLTGSKVAGLHRRLTNRRSRGSRLN